MSPTGEQIKVITCSVLIIASTVSGLVVFSGAATADESATPATRGQDITDTTVVATQSANLQGDVDPSDLKGSGTASDPYQISNASQLQAMEDELDAHYELTADIDASSTAQWNNGRGFDPIGGSWVDSSNPDPFVGSFDGNNHTITDLTVDRSKADDTGLFGYNSGRVTDVSITGLSVTGANNVGGLVGYNLGTVRNARASGDVNGSDDVGGLVGYNPGTIRNARASGDVNGSFQVGGLVGDNSGTVRNARVSGDVNGSSTVGGLVGANTETVRNARASGDVNGSYDVGGLVGYTGIGIIRDAFATGRVTGVRSVGGLVGYTFNSTITDAYWDTQTTGHLTSDSTAIGLTTAQMQGEAARTYMNGLDFENTWTTNESYPQLRVFSNRSQPGDHLSIGLDVETPESPQVGQAATTTVESSIPTLVIEEEAELTLQFLVDGKKAGSKTVTITGGETTETDFTTVFESAGETAVTVNATVTIAGQVVSESVSNNVTVSDPPADTSTIEGVAFPAPESLEDEIQDYRNSLIQDVPGQSFVLATQNELYIVFTQQEPTKGTASVEGATLEQNLPTENLTYGAVAATNVSFDTTGKETSVQEVADNSEQYRLDLVRINAHYRRISTLTDPDRGENVTLSATSGVLIENPRDTISLFKNIGGNARDLSRNTSSGQIDTILNDSRRSHLHTFSFETKFWTDDEATVDAIVLDPQSAAQQFVDEYDQAGIAHAEDGAPILYIVKENFQPRQMDNVTSIKSQSDSLDGEVIETEVRLYQETISVQETLEHSTGCNEDRLQIQTPQGPTCVNVVQDNLLHGGIAWNSIPQSREDILLVTGVSSRHQDSPEEFTQGRYRIEAEVVSTSRLNESFPRGSIIVIYEMERVGDISYESVTEEARSLVERRTYELTTQLRQQLAEDGMKIETGVYTETIQSATPGQPATVTFSHPGRGPVAIQQAKVNVSSEVQNLKVNLSRVAALPSGVDQPPGRSIQVLNISTSAKEGIIAGGSFQTGVSTAAIPAGENVTVYRYHDDEWTALNTTVVETTDAEVVVNVATPDFSYFAVSTQSDDSVKTEVSVSPSEQSMRVGNTVQYDLVVENADSGVGSYEYTINITNASAATITDFTAGGDPGLSNSNIAADGSGVTVSAALADTDDTGQVPIGTVTVTGKAAGSADITTNIELLGDESADVYTVTAVNNASVTVEPQAPPEYVGGAVLYNMEESAQIEVPFTTEVGAAATQDDIKLLQDGDRVATGEYTVTEVSPGRVLIKGPFVENVSAADDIAVDLNSNEFDNGGVQTVVFSGASFDRQDDLTDVPTYAIFQGTTITIHNTTDRKSFYMYNEDTNYFQSYKPGKNSDVFYIQTSSLKLATYNFNDEARFAIYNLDLTVKVDDLNITEENNIEGTVTGLASDREVTIELLDRSGEPVDNSEINSQLGGIATVEFEYNTSDLNLNSGKYTVRVIDDRSGIVAESSAITIKTNDDDQTLIEQYDTNGNGIETPELLTAISDWRANTLTTPELLRLIDAWRST